MIESESGRIQGVTTKKEIMGKDKGITIKRDGDSGETISYKQTGWTQNGGRIQGVTTRYAGWSYICRSPHFKNNLRKEAGIHTPICMELRYPLILLAKDNTLA